MMMLELQESDDFVFDAAAADKPVRFIEKFCRHYEGAFAGQPFILHPLQKRIVRDLFGWKRRATGKRRFTDCYFEAAVGAGKSPLLAAIGLYGLLADGEAGAQVFSLASTHSQARIVFDTAKRFALSSPDLSARLEIRQYEIRHPRSRSVWKVVSGRGPKAGSRPSLTLADEAHDWSGNEAYRALKDRDAKRDQPLTIVATNAGQTRASFCWTLREKAVAALEGKGEPTLYPVIWAADESAATDDPAAWRAANPLLGTTVAESKVRQLVTAAMGDPVEESNVRRLYLGIWPKGGAGRWLDLAMWDAASALFNASDHKGDALYIGLDLSLGDDLCAAVFIWTGPERFWVGSHFWVPRKTAERYEAKEGFPYSQWAAEGAIELLDEPTIGPTVRRRIAGQIIGLAKSHKLKAVCFDRYRSDEVVAALEGAGLVCVPVAQGYSLSPGCNELANRLKEGAVTIAPNSVLRWCAENAQLGTDAKGNIWPEKPNAKGNYAGKRGLKIDGISALVTALVEARKVAFPAARKNWGGQAVAV